MYDDDSRDYLENVRNFLENIIEMAEECIEQGTDLDPEEVKYLANMIGRELAEAFGEDFGTWEEDNP